MNETGEMGETVADFDRDIHAHLINKLRRVCSDVAQSCAIADCDSQTTVEIVMSGLMLEFIRGAACIGMSEAEFIRVCRVAYRAAYPDAMRKRSNRL
jgi:hypothetical protein